MQVVRERRTAERAGAPRGRLVADDVGDGLEIVALEAAHAVHDVVATVEVVAEVARHRAARARRDGEHEQPSVRRRLLGIAHDADALRELTVEVAAGLEHDVATRPAPPRRRARDPKLHLR